jgi:hypothetical protein
MPRTLASALALLLFLVAPAMSAAQEGTPMPDAGANLLTNLGLPELAVTLTETDATVPAEAPAGRLLVRVDNQRDAPSNTGFVQFPPGTTAEQALKDMQSDLAEGPDWFYESVFAGGTVGTPNAETVAVLDLAPGEWFVIVDRFNADGSDEGALDEIKPLTVTGAQAESEEIPGAIDITLNDFGFDTPAEFQAGPQIWHLHNGGAQLHFLDLLKAPDGTTLDQVMQLLTFDESLGTPPPADMISPDAFEEIVTAQDISAGESIWIGVDLEPGTYVGLCFITDRESGMPHALLGMTKIFTVD